MEIPGFLTLLYIMWTLPEELGITEPLPWGNWTMAGMFVSAHQAALLPNSHPPRPSAAVTAAR